GSGTFSYTQQLDQTVSDGVSLSVVASAAATLSGDSANLTVTGTSGDYVVTDGTNFTALPFNATAGQIQTAIDGLAFIGPGKVTVKAVANQAGSFTIAPAAGTAGLPSNLAVPKAATATFSGSQLTVTGDGAYVLTDGTNFVALSSTATSDQIQKAL